MTNTKELVETIKLKDPYDLIVDPFDYSEENLEKPTDDIFVDDEEELVEEEEKVIDLIPKKIAKEIEDSTEAGEDESVEEETNEEDPKENPLEVGEELELAAAIGQLQYLAKRKGVEDKIDYDKISNLDDVADLLDDLEEFDKVMAVEGLKQTNDTIAKIVDFLDKDGKPEEILEYLTTSKEIAAIDSTTEAGAKELIKQYYTKVVKYPVETINKKLQKLEDNDMLLSEAEDLSPLYQEHLNKEIEQKTKKLEETNRLKQIKQDQDKTQFIDVLKQNKIPRDAATELFNTAFSTVALQSGEKKILLDAKFEQMKANPANLLKLVTFINNPEQYDAQLIANKGSEIVKKVTTQRLQISNNIKNKNSGAPANERSNKLTFNFNK